LNLERSVEYEDTEHYRLTRDFLNNGEKKDERARMVHSSPCSISSFHPLPSITARNQAAASWKTVVFREQ